MRDDIKAMLSSSAVSEEFLVEIGRITVHFALLEKILIDLTHRLLSLPENMARSITAELSFRGLQQLAYSLLKERLPSKIEEFADILKRVGKCEEKRNAITHSLWGAGTSGTDGKQLVIRTKYSAKQKKGLDFVRKEMTIDDLNDIAREISIVASDIKVFLASINRKSAV